MPRFEDPDWVQRWDVAFAQLYLDAGDAASRPWRLAFSAPAELPPLRHVLLGINAHLNYDLPQGRCSCAWRSAGSACDCRRPSRRRSAGDDEGQA
jgi:hypothetical protein